MMERDVRATPAGVQVRAFYETLFRPGDGHVWTAHDLEGAPDAGSVYFVGQRFDGDLDDGPSSAAFRLDLETGKAFEIAAGARLFRTSPSGDRAVCLSRSGEAEEKLQLVKLPGGQIIGEVPISGRVEAAAWSPAGERVLIVLAGTKADVSGAEGGFALTARNEGPSWLPDVTTPDRADVWRRLLIWMPGNGAPVPATAPAVNVWEASWLGDRQIILVASDHHSEGSWYGASVRVVDAETGGELARHRPVEQIGVPAGAPDGRHYAAIEAVCSDRTIICGSVVLFGDGHRCDVLDLLGVEASDIVWRDATRLLYAGLRGAETVIGEYDLRARQCRELWASRRLTTSGWYPHVAPFGSTDALAVVESYDQPPVIARLRGGDALILRDLSPPGGVAIPGTIEHISWRGRDGLEISGWLLLPDGDRQNLPLVVDVHGGPIAAHRNRYAAALRADPILVGRGYSVLLPNPRGSGGRGQDFARRVIGDMGGEDAHDILAGIDTLVAEGIVDPLRVGIFGSSYGGFMSATMVAHHRRFAAAVPMSPVVNWHSQHFASQIPWFDEAFLGGSPREAGGAYFDRSALFFLASVTTPTLVIAGARDKNTPASQAVELYNGLIEAGAPAALVVYPQDGHSLRGYPAYPDSAARVVHWFDQHL